MSVRLIIFYTEILGAAVRRESLFRGIQISYNECKISQYAYDTTLMLDGTRSLIERSFVLLNIFAKIIWPKSQLLEDRGTLDWVFLKIGPSGDMCLQVTNVTPLTSFV